MRRTPFIEQMNQSECGIACVAMISAYHKKHISLVELREYMVNSRDGNSLYDLNNTLKILSFDVRAFKSDIENLKQIYLPAIIYWGNNHFVILDKIKDNKYYIVDPSEGRKTLKINEFKEHYTGYVLQAKPNSHFTTKKEERLWTPYIKLFFKEKKLITVLILFSLILQSFIIVVPIITQFMLDEILLKSQTSYNKYFIVAILIFVINYFAFNFIQNEISLKLFKNFDFNLSHLFFKHLLKVNYSYFETRTTGDLLYRFSNLRNIRSMLSNQLIELFLNILLIFIILIYMIIKSVYMSIIIFILVSILYCFILILRPFVHEANRNELSKDTDLYSHQAETVSGILDIKISGSENYVLKKWIEKYQKFILAYIHKGRIIGLLNSFTTAFTFFIPLVIIWIGIYQITSEIMTIGELMAFQSLAVYFISTSKNCIMSLDAFFQLKVYLRRIKDVIDTPIENNSSQGEVINIKGNISLRNVNFSYSKVSQNVLDNITFDIKAGEKVAIIGPSGAGKSTLAKILTGLYTPSQGNIFFENKELTTLNKTELRKQIGSVPQEPYLFNESIKNNLTNNNTSITMERMIEVCKIVQIHDEIMRMPMGYETILSEMGQNLSGGQRQRLAIARAIIDRPNILLLDESTNSLDSINERKIDQFLSRIKTTRIVIAHRLSTIRDSDKIIIINNGKIVGIGKHDYLLQTNHYYYNLYRQDQNLELKGGE
ncbi:peptidase domain-containing ABC transporter [Staphylococcus hominis]|uniref:peptidase domain-containing ABC transporter n=1 Tax=Staphylococcus hominis TaxID=1290 RepID=UPI001F59420C|nr:peptidase domain-containing ABC transporter [Staphylococcus hominis]MCI2877148.1 peptidase domain-containing ABC transporter [Staphylococcus hominis]